MARRTLLVALMASLLTASLGAPASAVLPSEQPADTFQVNMPRVRTIALVGDNVWLGGRFTQVQSGDGRNVSDVTNLAVLSRTTGALSLLATPLELGGATNAEVWKLATDGETVFAAGKFSFTSGGKTYKNLVAFDGTTGALVSSFRPVNAPVAQAVTVGGGIVYAGGKKLIAVNASTGEPVPGFVASTVATDSSLRARNTPPQHRDLELINGYLYSACQCDSLTQQSRTLGVKALVRFDPVTGLHDESFIPEGVGVAATGVAVATDGADLYLGAGGSDFIAKYSPTPVYDGGGPRIGKQLWKRDTSGSVQDLQVSGGDVIIGGHFVEIADASGDSCGFKSSSQSTLDPNNECQTRNRLAAYTITGELQTWNPSVTGKYNGVWAIALDGTRTHIGGEFTKVGGTTQTNYARLD